MSRSTCVAAQFAISAFLAAIALNAAVPAPTVTLFSEESVISLDRVDPAIASNLPPDVLAAIKAGAQEIHQLVNYDPTGSILTITGFLEAAGAPLPTPMSPTPANIIWSYIVQVDRAELTTKPTNGVVFMGAVNAATAGPFGALRGAMVVISAAYAPAPPGNSCPTQFSAVTTDIVGTATILSATGTGNLQTSPLPTNPIAIAGPKGVSTYSATFQLDGTQSYDPSGGTLTYQWILLPVQGQTVDISGATTATPTVSFPQTNVGFGEYKFQLTVTNPAGATASDTVVVTFINRDDQPPIPR